MSSTHSYCTLPYVGGSFCQAQEVNVSNADVKKNLGKIAKKYVTLDIGKRIKKKSKEMVK